MNKILLAILFLILFVACICGCQQITENTATKTNYINPNDYRMVYIGQPIYGYIVYDSQTNVEYWLSRDPYNIGSLTLLVDAEGKPLIYKADK